MGLISRLFGGDNKISEAITQFDQPASTGAGGIRFDPGLVGRLKGEHQELVKIFTAIKDAVADGRFSSVPDLLASFKHTFLNHLGEENVKFYVYMQQCIVLDEETMRFVSGVRREMNDIARAVMKFVDRYIVALPSPATLDSFNNELEQIGEVLVKRVQMEESRLYSLYRP